MARAWSALALTRSWCLRAALCPRLDPGCDAAKCRDFLKKEAAVDVLLGVTSRYPDDDLIQKMASEAVVNVSQLGDDSAEDPNKAGAASTQHAGVAVRPPPPGRGAARP